MYTIHHVVRRLFREGVIERDVDADLYKTAQALSADVRAHFDVMGMDVIEADDRGVFGIRNKSEDALDAQSEDLKSAPILPVFSHNTLNYFESRAAVYALSRLHQEMREGQGEVWISQNEYIEFLSKAYSEAAREDEAASQKRVLGILSKLEKEKLLMRREQSATDVFWRSTNTLFVFITRGDVDALTKALEELLTELGAPMESDTLSDDADEDYMRGPLPSEVQGLNGSAVHVESAATVDEQGLVLENESSSGKTGNSASDTSAPDVSTSNERANDERANDESMHASDEALFERQNGSSDTPKKQTNTGSDLFENGGLL